MEHIYKKLCDIVRGKLELNAPLAECTTLGVGGNADLLFIPVDTRDLQSALKALSDEATAITILGGGSNLLIRGGGIRGLVILTTGLSKEIKIDKNYITCPAGARTILVSKMAADAGISGFEFLCGIPGTIGGAVCGNAGAYGGDMSNIVESVELMDFSGNISTVPAADLGFGYRASKIPKDNIIISVAMRGWPADISKIIEKMESNTRHRMERQPAGVRTCGSLFKNPDGGFAAKLIDDAGLRGFQLGGAAISEKHANFLLNLGAATAAELEDLAAKVHDEVLRRFGIDLEPEVKIIGDT
jgi:UDP-N-acetylmuramate dehydrogenase